MVNNDDKMKKLRSNQRGFITEMVIVFGILIAAIILVFMRVQRNQ